MSRSERHGAAKKVVLDMDEQLLLRELVHPMFAEMPPVRLSWTFFGCRQQDGLARPNVCSTVKWLAGHMAAELRQKGRRRRGRSERAVTVPESQAPEVVLAALSLALYLADVSEPLAISMQVPRRNDRNGIQSAWKGWQQSARSDIEAPHLEPLCARAECYKWVQQDTHPCSYLARLAGAFGTLRHGARLASVPALLRGTRLLSAQCRRPPPRCNLTAMWHCDRPVLEVAAERARQGFRVAAVNAASAYSVGGGFLSGGRHALEEAMCMQSTLYFSLQRAAHLARECRSRDGQEQCLHIPEDGAILSPDIEIFRNSTAAGYGPCVDGNVRLEAILSVAMPNMNPSVKDCPLDWHSKAQRDLLVERKLHAVLQGAAMVDAEVLVVPDVGCGVYGNDPRTIGAAFGRVLYSYPCFFTEVIISGSYEFFSGACEAAGSRYNSLCRQPFGLPEKVELCKTTCEAIFPNSNSGQDECLAPFCQRRSSLACMPPCCGCMRGLRILCRSLASHCGKQVDA